MSDTDILCEATMSQMLIKPGDKQFFSKANKDYTPYSNFNNNIVWWNNLILNLLKCYLFKMATLKYVIPPGCQYFARLQKKAHTVTHKQTHTHTHTNSWPVPQLTLFSSIRWSQWRHCAIVEMMKCNCLCCFHSNTLDNNMHTQVSFVFGFWNCI